MHESTLTAFDIYRRKTVELEVRRKGISETLARALKGICEDAKTKVKFGMHLSEEFHEIDGLHQGSVLPSLLITNVIDVVTCMIKAGLS